MIDIAFAMAILRQQIIPAALLASPFLLSGCSNPSPTAQANEMTQGPEVVEAPDWFNLRPEVERAYGYTHAVRVGDRITVSGAVSMDDEGNPTAVGDLAQQMRNCYADLHQVLVHYGCTFDDVVAENIFTTDMAAFLEHAAYRSEIYTRQFPAGTWLEVKGLALPELMIEIELEVHKAEHP